MTNPYQYTGRENDGDGLYNYRARYYAPGGQGFLSEDPIGLRGGSTNFYEYVGGDPVNRRDPTGLIPSFSDFVTTTTATFDTLTGETTTRIRNAFGIGYGGVDPCSGLYRQASGYMRFTMGIELGLATGYGATAWLTMRGWNWMAASIFGNAYGGFAESWFTGNSLMGGATAGAVGGALGGFVNGPGGSSVIGEAVGGGASAGAGAAGGGGIGIGIGRGKRSCQ